MSWLGDPPPPFLFPIASRRGTVFPRRAGGSAGEPWPASARRSHPLPAVKQVRAPSRGRSAGATETEPQRRRRRYSTSEGDGAKVTARNAAGRLAASPDRHPSEEEEVPADVTHLQSIPAAAGFHTHRSAIGFPRPGRRQRARVGLPVRQLTNASPPLPFPSTLLAQPRRAVLHTDRTGLTTPPPPSFAYCTFHYSYFNTLPRGFFRVVSSLSALMLPPSSFSPRPLSLLVIFIYMFVTDGRWSREVTEAMTS